MGDDDDGRKEEGEEGRKERGTLSLHNEGPLPQDGVSHESNEKGEGRVVEART